MSRFICAALLALSVTLPAGASIDDVTAVAYPDPADRVQEARAAAAGGGALENWALAEALVAVHDFESSDRAFAVAARRATGSTDLDQRELGLLARRLEQRRLLGDAIGVLETRIVRALKQRDDLGAATRAGREHEATAVQDLKQVADLHKRQLRWAEFYGARERVLDAVGPERRGAELSEYLDLLLGMDQTARALVVARANADLTGDVDVLRRCAQVMIREREQTEAHRMLRLAVASSMDYWTFRSLMVDYLETFDPGIRWASDRDERLRQLLVGRPMEAVDNLLLGSAYHVVGDRDREEQAYRDYLDTGGVTPAKLRHAGDLMFGMGKTAEAFLLYQRYLAEYPSDGGEAGVLLHVVDCLERTWDLETSFHGAFNAFGYLFLDERTPQLPVGVLSVLFNDVPLQSRLEGLEDALDRYYVDLLAVDVLWNVANRHAGTDEAMAAHRRLLDYYRRYEDDARQLEICDLFIAAYADEPEANDFRFDKAAIHNRRDEFRAEEDAYRAVFEATVPPEGMPRPYEPVDPDERTRVQQHERAFRSLVSLYDRDRAARFVDAVALYRAEIDLRGGDLDLVAELVRVCDQRSAYDDIEAVYREVIRSYDTMSVYDKLARHYLRMQRTAEAERVYTEARKRFADQGEPHAWLAGFYSEQHRYGDAEAVLRNAVDAFPDDLDWYERLASVGYSSGGKAGRCAVYTEAMDRHPHEWRFIRGALDCHERWEDQLVLLEREQLLVPEARDKMLRIYGREYLVVDRIAEAEAALEGAPDDPVLHRYLGDLYHALSAFEQSLDHYERAAEAMPDDAELLKRVAELQRSFGRLDDAAQTLTALADMRRDGWAGESEIIALESLTTAPRSRAVATTGGSEFWTTLGEVRAEAGDGDGATAAWEKVIEADRSDPELWLEVASACWDYFLFDAAVDVFQRERRTLGDPQAHAKQLAAVYESKRDYRRAIDEYVTILAQGDPMVREDVRIRLVYLARHKELDSSVRRSFGRAIKAEPDHEGLYRNYADYTARLEDWDATFATYEEARRNVRERHFLEWLAGEFERLEQMDRAEATFADLATTYASDRSAWDTFLAFVSRRYTGARAEEARLNVLAQAHYALPTAGYHRSLNPLLEKRGDIQGVDRALRVWVDALEGGARLAALNELALSRIQHGDVTGAELVLDAQRGMKLDLTEQPASWTLLDEIQAELLALDADPSARRWLTWLQRDLPVEFDNVDAWVTIGGAWYAAGRADTAGEILGAVQEAAPYRVDATRTLADLKLAQGDEAGAVEVYEESARLVGKLQDNHPAMKAWWPVTAAPDREVSPEAYGFYPLDREPPLAGYDYNPFGDILAVARRGWDDGGYDHGYEYDYGYGYEYGYGHGYDHGYDAYDAHAYYPPSSEDPATRGKRVRRQMRLDLRRAEVEMVVSRGMRYDGVTAYERMVNDDPLNLDLLAEAWRHAALAGYGDEFRAYYADVLDEAGRDFRWYRVMAELDRHAGDLTAAAEGLEKLLLVEPQRIDVHTELVDLYRQLGRDPDALEHLDRVRFLSGDDVSYYRQISAIAYAAGQTDHGRRQMIAAHDLDHADRAMTQLLAGDLVGFGDHDTALRICRRFFDAVADRGDAWDHERNAIYRVAMDAALQGGDARGARDLWWEAYRVTGMADDARFGRIYGSPGMEPTLRRDFEMNQEHVVVDSSVRGRFEQQFAADHLYREHAALRTLVLDAGLLDQARRVSETYGNDRAGRQSSVDPTVRRRLAALAGDDHRAVYREVDDRPVDLRPGDFGTDHAVAIKTLLDWERRQFAAAGEVPIRSAGQVSYHTDVQRYASTFDSGHRGLSRYYQERHLFLDAAAELRQIESLFGPLYNDVYAQQLDLLAAQTDAGVHAAEAGRERGRILRTALYACLAELDTWPRDWAIRSSRQAHLANTSLYGYMRHAATDGHDAAFLSAMEQALKHVGVAGPYADTLSAKEHRQVLDVLAGLNALSRGGGLGLAEEVHRRTMGILPDEVTLQRAYLDLLGQRAEKDVVLAAIEELIQATGRLWVYRWAVEYHRSGDNDEAALAMTDRTLAAFATDLDTRLTRIDLLVALGKLEQAGEEARFLVGDQTVGGYLQGSVVFASAASSAPPDQTRTAVANHTIHGLTVDERERLFAVWAMGSGDAAALSYLAEKHPRKAAAYEQMARTALAGGHHDLALACLDQAAVLYPEDPARLLPMRGEIEWSAGQRDRAMATWTGLAGEPYVEAVQQAFELMWSHGERERAVELAASEVVRRRGFSAAGGGQGLSIVSTVAARVDETRDYDRLAQLYMGVVPGLDDPWLVAQYAAHLRAVHRDEASERFLDAVLDRLDDGSRQSVLFSIAALAREEGRPMREAEALASLGRTAPATEPIVLGDGTVVDTIVGSSESIRWRSMRVRALAEAGHRDTVDEMVQLLADNLVVGGVHDMTLAANLMRVLARSDLPVDPRDVERIVAALADERYDPHRDGMIAPMAELELAAGRPDAAVAALDAALADNPAARRLWGDAIELLEDRGARAQACAARGRQADHLLTYLPADSVALLTRARAQACEGDVDRGVATAASAQDLNPGRPDVVLERARFLLHVGLPGAAIEVARLVPADAPEAFDASLLISDAALSDGDDAAAAEAWIALYRVALSDAYADDRLLVLASWATEPGGERRAEALAPALETLGRSLSRDPRPERLAAALHRHLGRPAAGETALRRSLDKDDHHPESVVQLVDLLLQPQPPPPATVDEARRLVEDVHHLDPGTCDGTRLDFRLAHAEQRDGAAWLAKGVVALACAGVEDLTRAEADLVAGEFFSHAIEAAGRLAEIDPDHRDEHLSRKAQHVEAFEAAAPAARGEEVRP